jgi:hypothetical protein
LQSLMRIPYSRLTDAVLVDLGYLEKAGVSDDASPMTAAEWDRRARELQRGVRPLSDVEVVQAIGPRPGEVLPPVGGDVTGRTRGGRRMA